MPQAAPPPPATESPKQREIRRREGRLLDAGFDLLREGGLPAVRMDAMAAAVGCTRTTLYSHFRNLDEVLVAMARRAVSRRLELFRVAVESPGRPRDRIATVCSAAIAYADEMPAEFAIEQAARHETVWERTGDERQLLLQQSERECLELVTGVVRDAFESGDLPAVGETRRAVAERIVFGLWSIVYGGLVLEATSPSLAAAGLRDPRAAIRRNCHALLDAHGWEPLYDSRRDAAARRKTDADMRRAARAIRSRES